MFSNQRFLHASAIPQGYRSNFLHLYFDIAWFGIASGSAINFLNVYAARLGATGFQIGLLAAMSAAVNLIAAIPAGNWLQQRPVGKAVFWSSVLYRLGYLLWIPLPWLFGNQGQIWALIVLALLMGIPLTALSVGFNALFAASVPPDWRAHVVGIRNVVLSVTFMLTSLGSGYLLNHLSFPANYQIIFGIGFLGAAMSSLHLFFLRPLPVSCLTDPSAALRQSYDKPRPTVQRNGPPVSAAQAGRHPLPDILYHKARRTPRNWRATTRADVWWTPFRNILLVMLGFHLTQYLAIPLFPLYFVRIIHLTDENIGIGTAIFYLTVLIGSTQLNRVVRKIGHHKVTGWGVAAMSLYPLLLAFAHEASDYYFVSAFGGFVWAMVSGAYANYLLENIPEDDRPAYLAWYNIILNACVLFGSLAGPFLASQIGIGFALATFGILRLLAGLAVLRWG